MEAKKYPKADLSRYSVLFFNIGLAIALLLVVTAFEWRFYDRTKVVDLSLVHQAFEDVMDIPPTEQPPLPPPKSLQQPVVIEVPDEEVIAEDIVINLDVEATEQTVIEEIAYKPDAPEEEKAEEIFTIVEEQPQPEGGLSAFYEYVRKNLNYPAQARRLGIEGKVYVQFVVDKTGKISDVEAIKGIGAGCDEEAIQVLQNAPAWHPGKQRGRPVKVRMILPITFKLG